jgi:hypothetical protein
MIRPANVVAVAGDPGGAIAVAPVISRLRCLGRSVTALAYRQARSVWLDRGVSFGDLAEDTDAAAACRHLEGAEAALLVTGTSFNGVDLEKRFLAAARIRDIPSVTILDFWSNYRVRFADEQGRLAYLPDRIAVMDEYARGEMIADGFDEGRLVVTGQPAFDELAVVGKAGVRAARTTIRHRLGITEKEQLVLFASQPLAELYGEDAGNPLYLGYTQRTVLRALVTALDSIVERNGKPITLLVRPHPREQAEHLQLVSGQKIRVVVDSCGHRHEAALAADLVAGMNTVLLMEACLLGCVVASLQPNLRLPDALPTNRMGASLGVYRFEDIEPTLEKLLFDGRAREELVAHAARLGFEPDAAGRVVSLIDQLTATWHRNSEVIS